MHVHRQPLLWHNLPAVRPGNSPSMYSSTNTAANGGDKLIAHDGDKLIASNKSVMQNDLNLQHQAAAAPAEAEAVRSTLQCPGSGHPCSRPVAASRLDVTRQPPPPTGPSERKERRGCCSRVHANSRTDSNEQQEGHLPGASPK